MFKKLGGESAPAAPVVSGSDQVSDSGKSSPAVAVLESAVPGEKRTYPEAGTKVAKTDSGEEDQTAKTYVSEEKEDRFIVLHDIQSIASSWKEIADRVGRQKPHVGPSLAFAVPESFENGKLTLIFQNGDSFHCKTTESNLETIEEIIGTLLGEKITIVCVIKHQNSAGVVETVAEKKNEIDDLISREPIIKDILDRFNGEINDTWRE